MALKKDVYRVDRSEDKVYVQQMSGKDAAGNIHFITIATLKPDDVVWTRRSDTLVTVADADNATIIDCIT